MFNRSVRCPACQAEHVREYGRTNERRRRDAHERRKQETVLPTDYVIFSDPRQGWGSHTALSFNVIVGLVKARYLEPGTVFRNHLWEIEIKKDWTIERRRLK